MTEPALLDHERVIAALDPAATGLLAELDIHRQIDSTNAEALRRIAAGVEPGYVCVAEEQLAGRGRRGRGWVSPFASNIYMSLVWRFPGDAGAVQGLSLAVGVAVVDALTEHGVSGLKLKWPNDVLHGGTKLGGILVELSTAADGSTHAVVGIGLNVDMSGGDTDGIDQAWTDIASISSAVPDRSELLAALLDRLLPMMPAFEAHGFAPWAPLWSALDAHAGQTVSMHSGEHEVVGQVVGIDERGGLQLDVGGTVQTFLGGEVSLRIPS